MLVLIVTFHMDGLKILVNMCNAITIFSRPMLLFKFSTPPVGFDKISSRTALLVSEIHQPKADGCMGARDVAYACSNGSPTTCAMHMFSVDSIFPRTHLTGSLHWIRISIIKRFMRPLHLRPPCCSLVVCTLEFNLKFALYAQPSLEARIGMAAIA